MTILPKQLGKELKLAKISKAQLRFVLLAVISLAMVVYGYQNLVTAPLKSRLTASEQQIRKVEEEIQRLPQSPVQLDQQVKRLASLKQKMEEKQQALKQIQQQMATEQDISRVVKTLAVTESPADFTLLALRKKAAEKKEHYLVQPFEVSFQADYRKMASYLENFSSGEKLYTIGNLKIITHPEILPRVEVLLGINNYQFEQKNISATN
ncbi:MAG: type 4a pilus biogenesis protein PilO [Pseudomonadota bacterium]|nr:type 4a pilus biogenesis protein PilO [Pseudomonadota bacterium]